MSEITYDKNSHVFKTFMKNGTKSPLEDLVVYDGGTVFDEYEEIYDGGEVTDN